MRAPKAGDVAMITAYNRSAPYRAFFDGRTWRSLDATSFCVDTPTTRKPIAVIDPANGDQIDVLIGLLVKHGYVVSEGADLRSALREFVSPVRAAVVGPGQIEDMLKQVQLDRETGYWSEGHPEVLDATETYLRSLADQLGVTA